jgi:hypothetical protein
MCTVMDELELNPLKLIDVLDVILCINGMVIRLISSIIVYKKERPLKLVSDYFKDTTYMLRWCLHINSVIMLMSILPVFVDQTDSIKNYAYIVSSVVGILGYDMWKIVVKLGELKLKKMGVDFESHSKI